MSPIRGPGRTRRLRILHDYFSSILSAMEVLDGVNRLVHSEKPLGINLWVDLSFVYELNVVGKVFVEAFWPVRVQKASQLR